MAFLHGKRTKVYLGKYEVSSYFNEISSSNSVETGETTTFNTAGFAKTYITGIQDGTIATKGLFDGAALAIDDQLATILSTDTDTHLLYGITGLNATNDPVRLAAVRPTSYQVSSPVGDVVSVSADFQANGGVQLGIGLVPTTVATATTGNATSYDSGIVGGTTKGASYQFHVTANTRSSTTTLYVYHSTDNSTFAALGAGLPVTTTATGSYRLEIAAGTTVHRYVRFNWTTAAGSGSISFVGAFARR